MTDQRRHVRDDSINPAISCLVELPDGATIDGVVIDISDTGARIAGATAGLEIGGEYRIVLIVQCYQKVAYQCAVRHIDAAAAFFGIEFTSRPQLVKPELQSSFKPRRGELENDVKRCPVDGRVFPVDYRYCPFDKSNLVLEHC